MQLDPGSQYSALFQVVPYPNGGLWLGKVLPLDTKELSGLLQGAVLLCIPGTFPLWVSEESVCTEGECRCFNLIIHRHRLFSRAEILVFIQGRVQSPALASGGSCVSPNWFLSYTPFLGGFLCSDSICKWEVALPLGVSGRGWKSVRDCGPGFKWAECVLLTWLDRGEMGDVPCDFT